MTDRCQEGGRGGGTRAHRIHHRGVGWSLPSTTTTMGSFCYVTVLDQCQTNCSGPDQLNSDNSDNRDH